MLTVNGATATKTVTAKQATFEHHLPDRVVTFMRLVALSLETRRDLAEAVRRRRKLDTKVNDPALADHPGRPAAMRKLGRRRYEEHHAAIRVIQGNVSLSREWDEIAPEIKHRYGLTFLVGETNPTASIMQTLYRGDVGLARLVPYPDAWEIPDDLAPLANDDGPSLCVWPYDELMRSDYAPF